MTKIIGYRNAFAGDQSSELISVVKLGKAEALIREQVATVNVELGRLTRQLSDAKKRLGSLQAKCQHHVFKDSPGFPYAIRTCMLCNQGMGLV